MLPIAYFLFDLKKMGPPCWEELHLVDMHNFKMRLGGWESQVPNILVFATRQPKPPFRQPHLKMLNFLAFSTSWCSPPKKIPTFWKSDYNFFFVKLPKTPKNPEPDSNYRFLKVLWNMLSIAYFQSDFKNVGTYLLGRA